MGQGPPATHLVVDVLARRCAARGQDVIVVAVVNDQDTPWPHHAGDVPQGQLVVTLVPWGGNHGVPRHWLHPTAQPVELHLAHTNTCRELAPTILPPPPHQSQLEEPTAPPMV